MSIISEYLTSRKQKRVIQLLKDHSGRCKAVGFTLGKLNDEWVKGEYAAAKINKEKIHLEEKTADNIESELILEVAKSNLPDTKLKEDLISFIRILDSAAGSAKRAATNMLLIVKYPLPSKFANLVEKMCSCISEIFGKIDNGINNLESVEKVKTIRNEVDQLENDVDHLYSELKEGYFELEKSFNSVAALIILDHVSRDLEAAADKGEDAADLLAELVQRQR